MPINCGDRCDVCGELWGLCDDKTIDSREYAHDLDDYCDLCGEVLGVCDCDI